MQRPDHEIEAFLHGQPTPEQTHALEAWLQADPAHADEFLSLVQLHQQIGQRLRKQRLNQSLQQNDDWASPDDSVAADALAELVRLEAAAPSQPMMLTHQLEQAESHDKGSIAASDFAAVGGYLIRHALTPKRLAYAAVAAVLLIAGTVLILQLGPGQPGPTVVQSPNQAVGQPVATLTAQHNATWGGPASAGLATGDTLRPNQRLTLTAGLAEITTNDGAVVILEAPATVELLDSNNAIRLIRGKLVGICETQSSKGFLVRTPHMDVTDLGTRFGVDVSRSGTTEVHVLEGEVQVARPDTPGTPNPQRLVAGQSVRASAQSPVATRIDHDADRFAALLPDPNQLPGTGFGLKVGDTDPNWQIVAIDGKALDVPLPLTVGGQGHTQTHRNDPASSQWLTWLPSAAEQNQAECIYLVRTTLDLPQAIATPGAHLALQYMADNELRAVYINGTRIALPEVDVTDMFTKFHKATIDRHLKPGQNTIEFELVNLMLNGGKSGEAGFRIAWESITPTTPPPGATR